MNNKTQCYKCTNTKIPMSGCIMALEAFDTPYHMEEAGEYTIISLDTLAYMFHHTKEGAYRICPECALKEGNSKLLFSENFFRINC